MLTRNANASRFVTAVGAAGKELFFPSNYVKKVPKLQRPKKPAMPPITSVANVTASEVSWCARRQKQGEVRRQGSERVCVV